MPTDCIHCSRKALRAVLAFVRCCFRTKRTRKLVERSCSISTCDFAFWCNCPEPSSTFSFAADYFLVFRLLVVAQLVGLSGWRLIEDVGGLNGYQRINVPLWTWRTRWTTSFAIEFYADNSLSIDLIKVVSIHYKLKSTTTNIRNYTSKIEFFKYCNRINVASRYIDNYPSSKPAASWVPTDCIHCSRKALHAVLALVRCCFRIKRTRKLAERSCSISMCDFAF